MIKEIKKEIPAHIAINDIYYCDNCGKKIAYPGTVYSATVSYCLLDKDNAGYNEQLENMYYYHLCNECIRKYVVNYLNELGFKAYKSVDLMTEEEYNNSIIKEEEE